MTTTSMYPLRFEPLFQRYVWGGRRLESVLGKTIGSETAAESWELVDHQSNQSVVAYGLWSGRSLRQLMEEFGAELVGIHTWNSINEARVPVHLRGRFPLLFKFLDAHQALSVQVHPNDGQAALLTPPDLGKTEAWYVLHADPGSKIFAGLKPTITRERFAAAIQTGQTAAMLHSFEPRVGDCIFIPAGTMHALGAGLVIAEIQQSSNTTFRVFDWDRVDAEGQSRPLHIEQALAVTNFQAGPVQPIRELDFESEANGSTTDATLVACDKFVLQKIQLDRVKKIGGDARMHLIAVISGELKIEHDPSDRALRKGEISLIPAACPTIQLIPTSANTELLEIQLP